MHKTETKDISLAPTTQVTTDDEVVINETNFDQYFFDIRKHKPQRGQVIARYAAVAHFVDGQLKRNVIDVLRGMENGGATAVKVLKKMGGASDRHSMKLAREMTQDLISGMTVDQVAAKEYPYDVEFFWYTEKKHIPTNDPHWSCISIRNLDDFLDKDGPIKMRILSKEEVEAKNKAAQEQNSSEDDH
jgi:hypothetical protein